MPYRDLLHRVITRHHALTSGPSPIEWERGRKIGRRPTQGRRAARQPLGSFRTGTKILTDYGVPRRRSRGGLNKAGAGNRIYLCVGCGLPIMNYIARKASLSSIAIELRESGRGLPQSKTLARGSKAPRTGEALAMRQSSAAFLAFLQLEPWNRRREVNTPYSLCVL